MQLTSLIGKQVLTPQGEKLGYVLSAYPSRNLKKISSYLCADEEEEEFFLPAQSVLSCKDALIANRVRRATPSGIPSPVGCAVFSDEGETLGCVTEVLLGDVEEPLFIVHHDGASYTYPLDRVLLGETLIVYPEGGKKPAAARKQTKTEQKRVARPAAAPRSAPKPEGKPAPKSAPAAAQTKPAAQDGINRVNLLGRRVKKSVYDGEGALIARAGEIISLATVAAARRKNRLLELTVNTLTNLY